MTVWLPVQCPHCHSDDVVKFGKSTVGKQRYRCKNSECPYATFSLNLAFPGRTRAVKDQMIEMSLNGSGIRDVARVLHVSPSTVIREIKKGPQLQQVNHKLLERLHPERVEVDVILVAEIEDQAIEESELDEMWSFVGRKHHQ